MTLKRGHTHSHQKEHALVQIATNLFKDKYMYLKDSFTSSFFLLLFWGGGGGGGLGGRRGGGSH